MAVAANAARRISEDDMDEKVSPRDRLIVALDLPSLADAEAMVARLGDSASRM